MILSIITTVALLILYLWAFYNMPILLIGVRNRARRCSGRVALSGSGEELPPVSFIVPVRDSCVVIGRLLQALLQLDYPSQKVDIVLVVGGSSDNTVEVCNEYAERYPSRIKLLHQPMSTGKPSALNQGLEHVKGEIVAVFDADSVPSADLLRRAVAYFTDSSVVAVQGRNSAINADQNLLTRIVSYEEAIAFQIHLQGRESLRRFVPLTGSCCLIRKSMIESVSGWDSESLSEDLEMAVRLFHSGNRIRYAPDVQSYQENPSNVAQLTRQRLRWFRGGMEVGLKYGKLVRRLNMKNADIELTLMGPFVFPICFLGIAIAVYTSLLSIQTDFLSQLVSLLASFLTFTVLLIMGIVLVHLDGQRRIANLVYLPFMYAYWIFESFIATYALFQIILRRPRKWAKIRKTGVVACDGFRPDQG